jgi:hypothetical protein
LRAVSYGCVAKRQSSTSLLVRVVAQALWAQKNRRAAEVPIGGAGQSQHLAFAISFIKAYQTLDRQMPIESSAPFVARGDGQIA